MFSINKMAVYASKLFGGTLVQSKFESVQSGNLKPAGKGVSLRTSDILLSVILGLHHCTMT